MDKRHWQNRATILLGAVILISPMALGFGPAQPAAMWNSWLIGVAILIVSVGRAVAEVPTVWQELVNLVLGGWLVISPWVLGFAGSPPARRCAIVSGLLVICVTLWTMVSDTDVRKWTHERHLSR
jgi:hypothetical protein